MVGFVYALAAVGLSIYGLQALLLTLLYLRHRRATPAAVTVDEDSWPRVVVQLPVYNERHVVERLIDAAAALDYPRDRLEIQVIDDSSDHTTALASARAARHQSEGVNIQVLRRPARSGYKAGALAWAMRQTTAEFVAVFDADFAPRPDFLRRTIPVLLADPRAGMVQTRWSHLNEEYSAITKVQALALDGHFVVEQTGRSRSGLLINFNGSGGVWRRACIEQSGGWQADTMTEDMDLSYRAQLAGWRSLYLPEVDAPAELPAQMEAFKRQQARWAQGSMQCLRKLAGPILRAPLTPKQKLMAFVHISGYLSQPLMVVLLLASLPLFLDAEPSSRSLMVLGLAGLGPPLLYAVAQGALYRDWWRHLLYLPVLAAIGAGISFSTSLAVCQGLTSWGGTFHRTPKHCLEGREGSWRNSGYRLSTDAVVIGELVLLAYVAATVAVALAQKIYGAVPFLLLYAAGYAWVAGSGLLQSRMVWAHWRRRPSTV